MLRLEPLTFILSPSARGEATEDVAGMAPPGGRAYRKIPAFLIHSAFVRVSSYCTVTSVPTGISEKNLRAVSSGNRMQPCDAG